MGASRARIKPPGKTQAERDAISLGVIESFLDSIAIGHGTCPTCKGSFEIKDVNPAVISAMKIRYDKLRPSLSAVEQTTIEPDQKLSEADILGKITALLAAHPDLVQQALAMQARSTATTGQLLKDSSEKVA